MGLLDRFTKHEKTHFNRDDAGNIVSIEKNGREEELSTDWKTSNQLEKEYRAKHPNMIQRWQQKRESREEIRKELRPAYREAYVSAAKKAVRVRARQEAKIDYGHTRKQKMANIGTALNDMSKILGGPPKKQTQLQDEDDVHWEYWSQRHGKTKNKNKHHPSDPFDVSGLDDIGDFKL